MPPVTPHTALILASRAAQMRAVATRSEGMLWARLRAQQLGVAFQRQTVIGPFIVDFVATSVRLVVEVDGGCHSRRVKADARSDRKLRRAGYRVMRIEAGLSSAISRKLSRLCARRCARSRHETVARQTSSLERAPACG
jgi:very-short-patch-repair endonuclease